MGQSLKDVYGVPNFQRRKMLDTLLDILSYFLLALAIFVLIRTVIDFRRSTHVEDD